MGNIRLAKGKEEWDLLFKGKLSPKTMLYFYDPEPQYGGYFDLDTMESMFNQGWEIVEVRSD